MKTKITAKTKLFNASKCTFKSAVTILVLAFFTLINLNKAKAADFYWVGGSGNWSDYANHWATTSGGVIFHTTIPSPLDDVYFDVNSFPITGDTVFLDSTIINCHNMDWTGVTNNPVFIGPSSLKIYGSLTLVSSMTWVPFSIGLWFNASTTGNTITSAGQYLTSILFDNPAGGWSLNDSLNTYGLEVSCGTFATNNQNVHCYDFFAGQAFGSKATVLLGNSVITSLFSWTAQDTSQLTLDAASATIIITNNITFTSDGFFGGSHQVYGDVSCNKIQGDHNSYQNVYVPYTGTIDGSYNTFNDVFFTTNGFFVTNNSTANNIYFPASGRIGYNNIINKAIFADDAIIDGSTLDTLIFNNPGKTISFGGTNTINSELVIANGTCNNFTILKSTSGVQATISKPNGNVTVDYAQLQNINATGGATFTANNSIDAGNVTGWTINTLTPKNLYWVGGAGDWNDNTHWAITSGGAGGNCMPTQFDNVFFDANSFSSPGDTVHVSTTIINCHNMDWTGVTNNPVFIGPSSLKIYGSLTLVSSMTWVPFSIGLWFNASTTGNTITSAGQYLTSILFDNPAGGWSLNDSLNTYGLEVSCGTFATNNQNVHCYDFFAGQAFGSKATVLLGNSVITSLFSWTAQDTSQLTLDAASATIIITNNITFTSDGFFGGSHQVYGDVSCNKIQGDHNSYQNVYVPYTGTIDGSYNTFNDVFFTTNGFFVTNNSTANNIYFPASGRIGYNNIINKAIFADDAIIDGSTLDTLIFNNPGKTISFGGINTINSELMIANGLPAFPTSVYSNTAGTQATISLTSDTTCTDYLYLQDINATGGGVFYAGANSVDLGNNTGWLWSSCTPDTSNVWPGDANYDLTADNLDVLYIGLAYGYTGATRAGASTNWVAQPAVDWLQQFANGTNIKHADCDGNGTINATDTLAVSLNYGLVHPFKNPTPPSSNNFGTDLYFEMPPGALTPGTNVSIPIKFGTSLIPASNIYGIGFTINYDAALIQAGTMQIDFSNSWLGTSANTIHLTKDFPVTGSIDMGYVKTDHLNSNGNGTIATLTFTVANSASGFLYLSFSDILVLDRNEFPIPVNAQQAVIYTAIDEQPSIESMINVYPNPASSLISISDANHIVQNVKLVDMTGRAITTKQNFDKEFQLDVSNVTKGFYLLSIETKNGILNKKIQITR